MSAGYVYVLSNESMPGLVKIGRSIYGGNHRSKAIFSGDTGVPTPFSLEFEIHSVNCVEDEHEVHRKLAHCRVNKKREFFKIEIREAIAAVATVCISDVGLAVTDENYLNEKFPESIDLIEDVAVCLFCNSMMESEAVQIFEEHKAAVKQSGGYFREACLVLIRENYGDLRARGLEMIEAERVSRSIVKKGGLA